MAMVHLNLGNDSMNYRDREDCARLEIDLVEYLKVF